MNEDFSSLSLDNTLLINLINEFIQVAYSTQFKLLSLDIQGN